MSDLKNKIKNKKATIAVIGLGYVGLPLAVEFARQGFKVLGVEIDYNRVANLKRGDSYILDVTTEDLKNVINSSRFIPTTDYSQIKKADAIIICVPTPLRKTGEPDLSFVLSASSEIKNYLSKGKIIILESTTYPGTTEEIILPLLQSKNFKVGKDFYLAFSPERVDPGNQQFKTRNIPKVIGGVTKKCTEMAGLLYSQIVEKVMLVSSPRVAEMVKLLENSFRSVNIALANETALICNKLGIDVWEVISVASTKPFGFMPFYPGPGIGGHCIPSDPMYLVWKARLSGYEPRLIKTAQEINSYMPHYVIDKLISALNFRKKTVKGAKVLVVGITYKPDVNDLRESPALEIMEELLNKGADIRYFDPYIPELKLGNRKFKSLRLNPAKIKNFDCVLIVT
ncbi:MAG TPA: nucleotide sugar dehydrogenase, partial [Candidatus Omnitrophica bacterium]|nr:nucleotide sugar dehydrogenase [Candidatus Omnitrophota bacterium]